MNKLFVLFAVTFLLLPVFAFAQGSGSQNFGFVNPCGPGTMPVSRQDGSIDCVSSSGSSSGSSGSLDSQGSGGSLDHKSFKLRNPLRDNVNSINDFVKAILENVVMPIGAVVVVIMIIYTGFLFVTARGNEEKLATAKHSLLWVLIGAAILLGALAISYAIKNTVCQIAPDVPDCAGSPATPFN